MNALIVASVIAVASPLPGTTGPLRYFSSQDDGTHLWVVDWTNGGKDYALIATDRAKIDYVLAYAKSTRGSDSVIYAAPKDMASLSLTESGDTLYEGSLRKQWTLYDWSSGKERTVHYVEVAAPAGSRSADDVVQAYVKGEGATKQTEQGTAAADIEKSLSSSCGAKLSIKLGDAAKAGFVDRAQATGKTLAQLCTDNDYKSALAKITEIKFGSSGKADTATTLKGKTIEIAFGNDPVNTPATVSLWLRNNL
jgi:hypothetical protein